KPRDARVQEQHVQAAMRPGQAGEELRDLFLVTGVGLNYLDGGTELSPRGFERLGVAPGDHDPRPFGHEPLRRGQTDTGRAAGDQGHPVLELSRHLSSFGAWIGAQLEVCPSSTYIRSSTP